MRSSGCVSTTATSPACGWRSWRTARRWWRYRSPPRRSTSRMWGPVETGGPATTAARTAAPPTTGAPTTGPRRTNRSTDLADRRPGGDHVTHRCREPADHPGPVRGQLLLHLHRLDDDDRVALGHPVAV